MKLSILLFLTGSLMEGSALNVIANIESHQSSLTMSSRLRSHNYRLRLTQQYGNILL